MCLLSGTWDRLAATSGCSLIVDHDDLYNMHDMLYWHHHAVRPRAGALSARAKPAPTSRSVQSNAVLLTIRCIGAEHWCHSAGCTGAADTCREGPQGRKRPAAGSAQACAPHCSCDVAALSSLEPMPACIPTPFVCGVRMRLLPYASPRRNLQTHIPL